MPDLATVPVPIREMPPGFRVRLVTAPAACGFPSPAANREDDALDLVDIRLSEIPVAN